MIKRIHRFLCRPGPGILHRKTGLKRRMRLRRRFLLCAVPFLIAVLWLPGCAPPSVSQSGGSGKISGDCSSVDCVSREITPKQEGGRFFRVCEGGLQERRPAAVPSLEGTVIVVFEVERQGSQGDVDLYAQRISAKGDKIWADAALVAASPARETRPKALPDGKGGAFVVFEAVYRNGSHSGERDLAAQRISAGGEAMWEAGKRAVIVSGSKAVEKNASLVQDGSGGFVAVFERRYLEGEHRGDTDVFAQRVSAEGRKLWGGGKTSIPVSDTKFVDSSPDIVRGAGSGYFVVNEVKVPTDGNPDNIDLAAQRLNESGKRTWQGGRQPAVVADTPLAERGPDAVQDGAGGMIVVYETKTLKGNESGRLDIAAQRVSSEGKVQWGGGRGCAQAAADKELQEYSPIALSDGRGGALVVYQVSYLIPERKGDVDIYAQRISGRGLRLWNRGKCSAMVAVSDYPETGPAALRLDDGSLLIAYELHRPASRGAGQTRSIGVQRVMPGGGLGSGSSLKPYLKGCGQVDCLNPVLAAKGRCSAVLFFETLSRAPACDTGIAGRFIPCRTQ